MAGFEGKTLEIDLSSGKVSKSALDKDMLRKFIGAAWGPS
jgi:aldehyde:ferredoxin oxidoreductase